MTAFDFLTKWMPDGPWAMVAIPPHKKGITGEWITDPQRLVAWLSENNSVNNCYFHSNTLAGPVKTKGNREDFAEVPWLHVDVDPRAGEDIKSEQARIVAALREYTPAPTVIVFSGGGYQAYWRLTEPIPIDQNLAKAEEAKLYNQYIELAFDADHCHSIDHIMRVPGTLNIPDERKLKKGRVPCMAELIEWNDDNVYPITMFPKAHLVQKGQTLGFDPARLDLGGDVKRLSSLDELLGVTEDVKQLIAQGYIPHEPDKYGSRSESLFAACCALVRAGVPDQTIYSIITDSTWAISASVIELRAGADRYAVRQIQRAKEFAGPDGCPELVELNERHAVICDIGGKVRVVSEMPTELNRTRISTKSFADFRNQYCNRLVQVGTDDDGKPKHAELGSWWVKHRLRRQYDTIVFAPGKEVQGAYNLWRGFGCEAKKGDCDLFLAHLHDNICDNDEVVYKYILGWMAHAVQKPDTPGTTAIVMRGRQGAGKGVFAKGFGSLFGRHFVQVSNSKHLTGNFNAHLRDAVVVFGDEAFYAGDKSHESVLKALVTEELMIVEKKGYDCEMTPNYVHLIMASNYDWVVPANADERRFMVIDVSDREMQRGEYFKPLINQFYKQGGQEALLHMLLSYDLTDFDISAMPKTAALQEQKVESMASERKWLYSKLQDGRWIPTHDVWERDISRDWIYPDYVEFSRMIGERHPKSVNSLAQFFSSFCGVRAERRRVNGVRGTFYSFPELGIMRQLFDEKFGGPFDWDDEFSQDSDLSSAGPAW